MAHLSKLISQANGWRLRGFTPGALRALEQHPWPGNVRELRNAVERLLLLADADVDEKLVRDVLPSPPASGNGLPNATGTLAARVEQFERETVQAELERAHHNMTEAAKALGLERSHLYKKCAQLAISVKELRRAE